jgi:hypothetical protein
MKYLFIAHDVSNHVCLVNIDWYTQKLIVKMFKDVYHIVKMADLYLKYDLK